MDLAELKFVVDTKQLEDAAKKVDALAVSVSKVNKPVTDAALKSEKLALAQAAVAEKTAKAETAQLKLQQAQEKANTATSGSVTVLERQNMILEYMAQGLSKGQSSYMATAKAAGALDSELQELLVTLKTQRTLQGSEPFDKSIGLMQKLQNETRITAEVNDLFNRNLGLSEKQMIDLAREKERLIALYKLEGRSLDGLAAEYDQIIRTSAELNHLNDARTNSMRQQVKAQNDASKATNYVASEMERVNRLTQSGGEITSATNTKLMKFEAALKQTGVSAAEQTSKLEAYKQGLLSVQKAAGNRQVDYLSRALGPQITDIAVGLATGQSPMMVLLQQGGQLRDQFALAGVAGADMGKMLVQASKSMVSSIKDIGLAVGQLVTGAIVGTGKAVIDFGMQITGTSALLDVLKNKVIEYRGENSLLLKVMNVMGGVFSTFIGVSLALAIAGFVALGVAMVEVIKEENALNRALNLTGASLGLTMDSAYDAAKGMEQFGVNTGTALSVLTEMAKVGGMSSSSLEMVATTAKAMKTAFNIPIADTVKQFKELQEKPTEALTKLAIKLGTIPVEVLKQVDAYERAGNSIKAAEVATRAYASAGKDAADRTVENFGTITRLGISLKGIWDSAWDSIMNVGRKGTLSEQIADKQAELEKRVKAAAAMKDSPFNRGLVDSDTKNLEAELLSLKEQDKLLKSQAAARATASAAAAKFEEEKKKRDEAANKAKSDANALENFNKSIIEQATKSYIEQTGALDHLTKSETELNKLRADPLWSKVPQVIKDQVTAIYEAASANEKLVKSEKDIQAALDLKNKLLGKSENLGKEYYKTIELINKYASEGKFGADEVLQLKAALEATTPEAKRLAAAQAENAKVMAGIAADRAIVAEQSSGDFKTANEKAAIKNLSDYRKKIATADAEYEKQISIATEETSVEEWLMYVEQANAKKALAKEVYDREQYLLSDGYRRNEAYANAMEGLFKGMGDALVDFALTGKTSFGEMVESMLLGLVRLEMQMTMSNMYKSMGGFGGIMSMFTGTPVPSANGNVFSSNGIQAFANGGTFTNSIVSEPTLFKFAKGTGLMGEAGPEAIMPLRRGSDGSLGVVASGSSGGNVSVQVINNSNAQATTQETTDSKGNRKIEVVIGDMTAGEISRNGSASQKSIKSTFGLQPQLIRR